MGRQNQILETEVVICFQNLVFLFLGRYKMIIEKVINNNVVSVMDESGKEAVVMGRGLGFGMKQGMELDEKKIDKVFQIQSRNLSDQLKALLAKMPLEHVQISNEIISYASNVLNLKFNQSIYVTLTDHINFAIERFRRGINLENSLLWEIKQFYSQEYLLGVYACDRIRERLHISLPEDEAGFIALHFVNAEYGTDIKEAASFPKQLKTIVNLINTIMGKKMDQETLHYARFLVHIKFLLQRVYKRELLKDEDGEWISWMKSKYPMEYACSLKVADCIERTWNMRLTDEECIYLAIHIRRVFQ